jgi:hypothetical protein
MDEFYWCLDYDDTIQQTFSRPWHRSKIILHQFESVLVFMFFGIPNVCTNFAFFHRHSMSVQELAMAFSGFLFKSICYCKLPGLGL